MKTLTTMTAIAALIAGISFANAQNSGNTPSNSATPPSSINSKATDTSSSKSGAQNSGAAMKGDSAASGKMTWKGAGKFCITQSAGSLEMDCKFASIEACQTEAKPRNLACQPNAGTASTTGQNSTAK